MKKQLTLSIIVKDEKILLGMKKRGFGMGKWNGFGGKVETGESIEVAMKRELQEEVSLVAEKMHQVAQFDFYFPNDQTIMEVHVYMVTDFSGTIVESEEMRPEWFDIDDIPYKEMWSDDIIWLPRILNGEKLFGFFKFAEDGSVADYQINTSVFSN